MKLYLSGPITGVKNYKKNFKKAQEALEACGFEVVNPARFGFSKKMAWADCMKVDLVILFTCDGVALLDGWEESRGARLETIMAAELGMKAQCYKKWAGEFARVMSEV